MRMLFLLGRWAPVPGCVLALMMAWGSAAHAATVDVLVHDAQGRPVADAVVFAQSREARALVQPAENVEIVQRRRQFQPAITVVPVGTAVRFPNQDTVRHHVYSFSPAKTFELKLYVGTPAKPVVFDQPGIAVLGCNIHDTMAAWVVIVDTPYHARTDASGRARLTLPAGGYRLRSWHAGLPVGAPAQDAALTVAANGSSADVTLVGLQP